MPLGYAVITERAPVIAYLGLGANLGNPEAQVRQALELLNAAAEVEVTRISRFYRTPPLGPAGQPWYVNAAARVRTRLGPDELLRLLHHVEAAMGRVRGEKWGPRVIDLDLLLYNGEVIFAPNLVVPHPEMHRRAFVLAPLAEIAPQAWHPVLQKSAGELLAGLDPADLAALVPISG
ncbi:MAG: 2-amino-4-hydroxy-6-hydroxymethyldihydropteridine diphosphokinase [Syntrophobacterales bacterium]|jgi:2-amino-4-hydroxy-6-hydroxymethyldihydropteridine diphosphokinase|nr:2-amino-4-hydroxy-6-hydroxymethyldihydropteridine diphosphokinase [Syntrophobacterales bacterium]